MTERMSKVEKTQNTQRRPVAVLASIRRPHSKNILDGCKELEIRLNAPRAVAYPFTVYIYEAKTNGGAGAIVGEFSCLGYVAQKGGALNDMARRAGLTMEQLTEYAHERMVYGWIVAHPKKYNRNFSLEEFGIAAAPQSWAYLYDDESEGVNHGQK